jgi:hypothetical protein
MCLLKINHHIIQTRKERTMFRRLMLAIATVAALGITFSATDSFAAPPHGGHYHGGGHHGGGGWHGGGWHGGGGWGGYGAGVIGGAIIGGMLAAPYYEGPYYYGPYDAYDYYPGPEYVPDDAVAYCMQRFHSYDPASGTYLGFDGLRHPCP